MNKAVIIIIVLLVITAGCGISVYLMYEKGYFEDKNTSLLIKQYQPINLMLTIKDSESDNNISSKFLLVKNTPIESCLSNKTCELYYENSTSFYSLYPELINTEINNCCYLLRIDYEKIKEGLFIDSYNYLYLNESDSYTLYFNDDKYYFYSLLINNQTGNNLNILLDRKAQELSIIKWGELNSYNENTMRLHLKADGFINNIGICFKWSFNIVDIKSDLFNKVNSPAEIRNTDNCYQTNQSLNIYNNFTTDIDFKVKSMDLTTGDYIKVYIYDEDYYLDDYYITEFGTKNSNIIGTKNFETTLSIK